MMYNRGNERIFNLWQEMGNPGWSFDDVLPYFKKSEDNLDSCIANNTHYHNTAGLQTIGRFPHQDSNSRLLLNALQELDLKETDINAESQAGSMRMQFFQNAGTRQSAGKAFLDPIRHGRPNLAIVTNARVTKVIVGHETREAEGVEYVLEDNKFIKRIAFASKEVLLCAGAVNSPQLLMLSGIGPIKTLQSLGIAVIEDLNVGRNLQNHFKTGIDLILDEKRQTVPKNQDVVDDILRYFWRHEGALASVGTFDVTAYINSTFSTRNFPDIQFLFFPQFFHPNQSFHTPLSYYNRISVETIAVRPRTRGYIAINTTDPFSQPIINYILDSHDIDVISQGNDFVVKELMNTKTLKENGMSVDTEPNTKCKDFTFGTFNYFRCLATNYSYPSYHFSGTCKMGPSSDRSAVVDSSLRVHKIKKLRVVDASVMPVLVNANPHAAVLMIAEKASDLIKEAWT
ncbi:glucose dehydrogenase [FAD, quinone]-like isoform X2 [Periplaneta americana]